LQLIEVKPGFLPIEQIDFVFVLTAKTPGFSP